MRGVFYFVAVQPFHQLAQAFKLQAQVAQHTPGNTAVFLDEAKQQVFGADLSVAQAFSLLMGQAQHTAGTLGKAFHSSQG